MLIGRDVPFAGNVDPPDRLSLYGMTAEVASFWDEIELWRDAPD